MFNLTIYIYYSIKIVIKILGVYCNKILNAQNLLPQIL